MKSGRDWSCWRSVGGERGGSCSSVRSTLDAPSPQENKDFKKEKMMLFGMFLCGDLAVFQENKMKN